MKSLEEQIGCRCVHFNGIREEGRACDAGIVYATVKGQAKGFAAFPCFREGEAVPCDKRHFPTPEEVAAEVAGIEARTDRLMLGMQAAGEDAKKHGFKKGNGGTGSVPCPVCKTGTLRYSVAGYNGHMHGRCTTADCVAWMQ